MYVRCDLCSSGPVVTRYGTQMLMLTARCRSVCRLLTNGASDRRASDPWFPLADAWHAAMSRRAAAASDKPGPRPWTVSPSIPAGKTASTVEPSTAAREGVPVRSTGRSGVSRVPLRRRNLARFARDADIRLDGALAHHDGAAPTCRSHTSRALPSLTFFRLLPTSHASAGRGEGAVTAMVSAQSLVRRRGLLSTTALVPISAPAAYEGLCPTLLDSHTSASLTT